MPAPPAPESTPIVVAIDGPAASGKSSTAQWVAKELGFRHVDSGGLYRAAAVAALRSGRPVDEWTPDVILAACAQVHLEPQETSFVPWLGTDEIVDEIRGSSVTAVVPRVAQMPEIRRWVNSRVRQVAEEFDVVVDGRDMGTAVFPAAQIKVFLVADPRERARRRLLQRLSRRPSESEIDEESRELLRRDHADATQTVEASDAVRIDTTVLTQTDQVERIVALVREYQSRLGPQFAEENMRSS